MLSREQWFALERLTDHVESVSSFWKIHRVMAADSVMEGMDKALDDVLDLFPSEKMRADLVVDPLIEALPKPTWPFEWVDLDEAKETLAHAEAPGYIPAGRESERKIREEILPAMMVELAYLRKVAFAARRYLDEDMEPKTTTGYHDWQSRLWQLLEYGEEDNGG